MKKILFFITILVLFVGCQKKECVAWFNPEYENIIINTADYINASDLAKKYNFYYEASECDNTRLRELLEIDGKEINVCGCIRHNPLWKSNALYTLGEKYEIPLDGHLMDNLPYDSTVYYVTGIARVLVYPEDVVFKKGHTDVNMDSITCIFIEPQKYTIKNK